MIIASQLIFSREFPADYVYYKVGVVLLPLASDSLAEHLMPIGSDPLVADQAAAITPVLSSAE